MRTIATICARGGSTGVPGKNIIPLAGIPLIAHTINQALSNKLIDAVYVSTDSLEIADVAKQFGAQVPFIRPSNLATNTAAKIPVIQHLADWIELNDAKFDRIVDLDPTSPLRNQLDIETCINLLDSNTDAVITAYESDKNPYFNMVEKKTDGKIGLVCNSTKNAVARQLAPTVYSMNASIYVWHRHTLEKGLWSGRLKMHIMPRERSIDIDSPLDLKLVELLIKETGYGRDN